MNVLIAPDKFQGSLRAVDVARALGDGIRAAAPRAAVVELPVADGGDGTVDALAQAGFVPHAIQVEGPLGDAVVATVAVRGDVALVEVAQTAGLAALGSRAPEPMRASSFGLGQAIAAAVDRGAREVIVGLGGSACTDGGAGMLQALGASLLDERGDAVPRGGAGLSRLRSADLDPSRRRLAGIRLVAACDVTNTLLGAAGTAAVFAPQKGATAGQVPQLEAGLRNLVAVAQQAGEADLAGRPGAGAAGGIGYGLLLLGVEIRGGADFVLDLLDFDARVVGMDLVLTGEGSLDEQSLRGKAPVRVAAAATRAGVPVVAAVGRTTLRAEQAASAGFARVYPLTDIEPEPEVSMTNAAALLRVIGARVAADWADPPG